MPATRTLLRLALACVCIATLLFSAPASAETTRTQIEGVAKQEATNRTLAIDAYMDPITGGGGSAVYFDPWDGPEGKYRFIRIDCLQINPFGPPGTGGSVVYASGFDATTPGWYWNIHIRDDALIRDSFEILPAHQSTLPCNAPVFVQETVGDTGFQTTSDEQIDEQYCTQPVGGYNACFYPFDGPTFCYTPIEGGWTCRNVPEDVQGIKNQVDAIVADLQEDLEPEPDPDESAETIAYYEEEVQSGDPATAQSEKAQIYKERVEAALAFKAAKEDRAAASRMAFAADLTSSPHVRRDYLVSFTTPIPMERFLGALTSVAQTVEPTWLFTWLATDDSIEIITARHSFELLGWPQESPSAVSGRLQGEAIYYLTKSIQNIADAMREELARDTLAVQLEELNKIGVRTRAAGVLAYGFRCTCTPAGLSQLADQLLLGGVAPSTTLDPNRRDLILRAVEADVGPEERPLWPRNPQLDLIISSGGTYGRV